MAEEEEENVFKTSSGSIVQAQDKNVMDAATQVQHGGRFRVRRQPAQQCKKTGNIVHCSTQMGPDSNPNDQPPPPPPPMPPQRPPQRPRPPPEMRPPPPPDISSPEYEAPQLPSVQVEPGTGVTIHVVINVKPNQGGPPQQPPGPQQPPPNPPPGPPQNPPPQQPPPSNSPNQGMVIPPNWGEQCRRDQAWCQQFITQLMGQGLMLYTIFPGLSPPTVNPAQQAACNGNQACLDNLKKEGQQRLVKSALQSAMKGDVRAGPLGADDKNDSGVSVGLIAAIVVVLCLALAVLAYFCCIRRGRGKKTGGGGSRGSVKSRRSIAGKSSKKLTSHGGSHRLKSSKSKRSLKSRLSKRGGSAMKSKKSSIKASRSGMKSSSKRSLKSVKGGSQKSSRKSFAKGSQKSRKK